MSLSCPFCGGEIVGLTGGTSPFPGWLPPPQSGANRRNSSAQSSAQSEFAHGSKDLSSEERKTYNQGYPGEFLKFWNIYPRKRDKRKALASWRNAIRRSSTDAINAGAKRYRDDPNRLDEFTKYAEGWLNGDGWEDEPLPSRLPRGIEPAAPKPMHEDDYRRLLEDR
jgi:hypothetical protein